MGIFTFWLACHTMRKATGSRAGPDRPPVLLRMMGRRVRMSMRIPVRVLIMEMASAPALSAATAISEMSVTLGESFTIKGFLQCLRTSLVMPYTPWVVVPNWTPPCFTLGQEMFSSIISTQVSFNFSTVAQ